MILSLLMVVRVTFTPKDTISYKSLYLRKQHGHCFPFLHVQHPSDRFNSVLLLVRLNSLRPFVKKLDFLFDTFVVSAELVTE